MKNFKLILLVVLVSLTGGVLGAAAQDRLSAIFNVGQGAAGSKAMVFDSGNGSSNAQVASTASTNMSLATGGTTRLGLSSTGAAVTGVVGASDGSNSTPAYSFNSDTDTGMYYVDAADVIGMSINGGERFRLSGTQLDVGLAGSAVTPTIIMNNDSNTGFYQPAADQIGISAGGGGRFTVSASQIDMGLDGSAATPSVVLNSDVDTGIYKPGANSLAIAAAGANVATFNADGINTSGGGAIKWKVCSGNNSAAGSTDCTPSGTVLGISGRTQINNGGLYTSLESTAAAGSGNDRNVILSTAANTVTISNDDASDPNDFTIVVYYQ